MNVSKEYALIQNLRNAADDHKRRGCDVECNVSLTSLLEVARRLRHQAPQHEHARIDLLLVDWPS